jgi:putative PIN family toxin of toxin-antitoxin system
MRVVLDTNCLVVCLQATSPYYCIWQAFRDMRLELCITTDIVNEYSEVLARYYNPQLAYDVINELLLSPNVVKVNTYYRWNLIAADPDDNKFVNCALNAGADCIVTNDKHFNVLKRLDFPPIRVADIDTFSKLIKSGV